MPLTASQLRADIYRILDEVLESGVPVEIVRKGRKLCLAPAEPGGFLERLRPQPNYLRCDPDELVELDWSGEWNPSI